MLKKELLGMKKGGVKMRKEELVSRMKNSSRNEEVSFDGARWYFGQRVIGGFNSSINEIEKNAEDLDENYDVAIMGVLNDIEKCF